MAQVATNAAQHKTVNLVRTLCDFFFVFVSVCVFNVWSKTTLLPVWPRDAKMWDTPARKRDLMNSKNDLKGFLFQQVHKKTAS